MSNVSNKSFSACRRRHHPLYVILIILSSLSLCKAYTRKALYIISFLRVYALYMSIFTRRITNAPVTSDHFFPSHPTFFYSSGCFCWIGRRIFPWNPLETRWNIHVHSICITIRLHYLSFPLKYLPPNVRIQYNYSHTIEYRSRLQMRRISSGRGSGSSGSSIACRGRMRSSNKNDEDDGNNSQ